MCLVVSRMFHFLLLKVLLFQALFITAVFAEKDTPVIKKQPLKIVFMFGQSEMVGQAKVSSASYMLQKPLVPPREATLNAHKAMLHQINGAYLYWQAMEAYIGSEEKKLKELISKRSEFRKGFKQFVIDELNKNDGNFRGKHYAKRRGFWLFNMLDLEAEKEGVTPKIRTILDAVENKFNVATAYEQLLKDSKQRYQKQLKLNQYLLKGTTLEQFKAFENESSRLKIEMQKNTALSIEAQRTKYASLATKHLNLPIAKRTHIVSLGSTAGTTKEEAGNYTYGPLSVGFGSSIETLGLEYSVGLALESQSDAPILIIKCAWNKRENITQLWRPTETGKEAWALELIYAQVKEVLQNLNKVHPNYDPKVGHELAGMVWFNGINDRADSDYGKHLKALITDIRSHFNNPKLPIVCATVGDVLFEKQSDDLAINIAMKEIAKTPILKANFGIVDVREFFPGELRVINSMFFKRKLADKSMQLVIQQATGAKGKRSPPYMGSAVFYLLAGNEIGLKLAEMINKGSY